METIKLNSWKEVTEYIDNGFWQPTPSYFEHIVQHNTYYPNHAFSKGQLASKSWLLKELHHTYPKIPNRTVAILGSWIGALVEPLHKSISIERIYGIDTDAEAIEKSEKLNRQFVQDSWKYKGVVHDVDLLDCSEMEFQTGGELINVKPDWIINTSCEHMSTLWYDSVDSDQLIIMQTNNSEEFEGHINTCESVEEMQLKYPLSETRYVGELITPAYTRYMQIGYK
jgi:hypothetical protein